MRLSGCNLVRGIVIASLASSIAAPAAAQTWDVLTPQLNAIEFGRQNAQSAEESQGDYDEGSHFESSAIAGNLVASLSAPQPAARTASTVATDFRSVPERTRRNLQTFVARTGDPQSKTELQRLIAAQPTVIEDVGDAIRGYGLDPHDVADAYAVWWINSWLVARKQSDDPDRETIQAVVRQVRNAISATPAFAQSDDADRQEYAEALLLQATMLASAFDQYENNPAMLDKLASAARQGARASGMDLSRMKLTRNGFVPASAADASDAKGASSAPTDEANADGALAAQDGISGVRLALAAGAGALLLGGIVALRRG